MTGPVKKAAAPAAKSATQAKKPTVPTKSAKSNAKKQPTKKVNVNMSTVIIKGGDKKLHEISDYKANKAIMAKKLGVGLNKQRVKIANLKGFEEKSGEFGTYYQKRTKEGTLCLAKQTDGTFIKNWTPINGGSSHIKINKHIPNTSSDRAAILGHDKQIRKAKLTITDFGNVKDMETLPSADKILTRENGYIQISLAEANNKSSTTYNPTFSKLLRSSCSSPVNERNIDGDFKKAKQTEGDESEHLRKITNDGTDYYKLYLNVRTRQSAIAKTIKDFNGDLTTITYEDIEDDDSDNITEIPEESQYQEEVL
ncbi:MAG: hypothetical protein PHC64_09335 [Candidatus Gastranaerophilales bacterium]|nr:hypothetical protein [Candidatus Gastranaerophilales bacterium]